ncbi:MAG TPA: plastocyanin/azurin family copper-binding protein, partial [Anseongella sp.]|nr:plastocyanin/azurin family copper-binding protein [Anseongella sp.]
VLESGILEDPDLNTRMAAFLAAAELPASEELGKVIYQAALDTVNAGDKWMPSALFAAAVAHEQGFLAAAGAATPGGSGLGRRIAEGLAKERYEMNGRDVLPAAPDVSGKTLSVRARVSKRDEELEGLILAQGAADNGYGIFIRNGKLTWVVNQEGKSYTAASRASLPARFELHAQLSEGGAMTLEVDGREVARAKAPSLFGQPLSGPLRTGRDGGNSRIAGYEGSFDFTGGLQEISLELTGGERTEGATAADSPAGEAVIISMGVVPDLMQYDKKSFTVKAGQKVIIEFENNDAMQHNMLVIRPGALEKVGAAADDLARNPRETEKQYVPEIPEVMYATRLLNPGEMATLEFTAPAQPGDYPYVCTFPGHWRGMNGIMKVEK